MKNLKLEVGKTYLNRKGERVKIVKETGHEIFPFDGDDSCGYTPNGEYWTSGGYSAFDLIAEAPTADTEKRTFKIPENTREISVSEMDGRIVIEFVPEDTKLTEREKIEEWLKTRLGTSVMASSVRDPEEPVLIATLIEEYVKHREAQQ